MNWTEAVEAMRAGAWVQRKAEQYSRLISDPDDDDTPVYECGEEPCRLATAVTADGQFVQVFQGVESKVLFEPEERHTSATDWLVCHAPAGAPPC